MGKTEKKLAANIAIVVLLIICLTVTTVALALATVSSEDNVFGTGKVAISLNGGNPVITENEFLFEPGIRVVKEFYIENIGTCDVWYRLYFSNLSGDLADLLDIKITEEDDTVLYSGKMSELTFDKANPPAAVDTALTVSEKRVLKLWFSFPEDASSEYAGAFLNFDLIADAVQKKNNETKNFD